MKFIVKKNADATKRLFLCIVDCELKNKVLEEKNKIIDLKKEYYCGEEQNEEEIEKLLEKAFSIHFIGNKSVEFGAKKGFVEQTAEICGIKYAIVMKF